MGSECYGYKKLNVWKKADELAYQIYIATRGFPQDETYGITSQLRRAGLSVPTNIVEGYSRQGRKELKHFVNIGRVLVARFFVMRILHLVHFLFLYMQSQDYTIYPDVVGLPL